MIKRFEVIKTGAENENKKDHKLRILRIINNGTIEVKIPQVSQLLHKELHKQKSIDTKGELAKYEDSREDVCLSFGVPDDDSHRFVEPEKSGFQRAFRAFTVFVDRKKTNSETGLHETFYAEGRSPHNRLLEETMKLMNAYGIEDVNMDTWIHDSEKMSPDFSLKDVPEDPDVKKGPRWLFFKGFLLENEEELKRLPMSTQNEIMNDFMIRKSKAEKIEDAEGDVENETARWFLTGSNVPSSPLSPEGPK